jgi:hypothetical protein
MEEFSDATVDLVFSQAANKVFQALGPSCPGFTTLLFRAQNIDDLDSADYLFAFIRDSKIDSSGRTTYKAVSVESHLLKHFKSYSDIFDLEDRTVTTNAKTRAENACRYAERNLDDEW